jgi:signal transduction histidine kinase
LPSRRTRLAQSLNAFVDGFIPPELAADRDRRQQARMFLMSHLFGPFLGNTTVISLGLIDPPPNLRLAILLASISGFWIFPALLRRGWSYNALALLSIENLIFCIFCGIYFYGGVASPVLPWALTIPLLSLLYLTATPQLWGWVLGLVMVNSAALWAAFVFDAPLRLDHLPFDKMQTFGIISTAAAAGYVAMMAIYYGKALASHSELETEMREHMATAAGLRRAAEEAERASAAKADFLARMSHELRTPLNAVIGYSQMLLEDAEEEGDAESAQDLEKIHRAGATLLRLVNEVLDLSKIEAGRMQLDPTHVSLDALIRATTSEFEARAKAAGLAVTVETAGDLGSVFIDAAKTRQALAQIVDNALKYTREGGVRIAARGLVEAGMPMIEIAVEDTGVGISPKALPGLFEQFIAEDDASGTKYGGRGLGLALARKLCRLMGGDITVVSRLGQGSVFTLSLPRGADLPDDRADDADIARLRGLLAAAGARPRVERIA